MSPVVIGSIGVALLLLAFVLNLVSIISERSAIYLLLNLLGAGMAAWYAWDSRLVPFLILESVWGLTAAVRLLLLTKKTPGQSRGFE